MALLRFLLLLLVVPRASIGDENVSVSYVIEPFETVEEDWITFVTEDRGKLNLTVDTDPAPFGNASLRIEYEIENTEDWGGYVGIGQYLNTGPFSHNCIGATHLSLWYKVVQPQSFTASAHLRVVLIDAGGCVGLSCADPIKWEYFYSVQRVLDGNGTARNDTTWQELRIEFDAAYDAETSFRKLDGSGETGNNGLLDLDQIVGWRIEFVIDSRAHALVGSGGAVVVDQLACVGGGDLFGAMFRTTRSFDDAVRDGKWNERFLNSPMARNMTNSSLENGSLKLDYTVQQTETWGGSTSFGNKYPARAYYNLSQAQSMSLGFRLIQPATVPGRVNFRVIVKDGSACGTDCAIDTSNMEHYYSFHFILDEQPKEVTKISLDLVGDSNRSSPFWRTGWSGIEGNDKLDPSHIASFGIEFSLDALGDPSSLVSGRVEIGNLTAVADRVTVQTIDKQSARCVTEPEMMFRPNGGAAFDVSAFAARACCQQCLEDENCVYGQISNLHCYMAPYVESANVDLPINKYESTKYTNFWVDDADTRGDFCERCDCNEADGTVDCSDKNLTIVPKTVSTQKNDDQEASSFRPRTLDLRGNPFLILIGSSALTSIADSLEELILPAKLKHLALKSIQSMPSLRSIEFEYSAESIKHQINNVITDSSEFFADVCCSQGTHVDLESPSGGLTFCNNTFDAPGVDAVYEPFVEYVNAHRIEEILESSEFMSEATESPEKCAEYCHIKAPCNYFCYDGRYAQSEHRCLLLATNGTPTVVEQDEAYGDLNKTTPGWTSGRVPRIRRDIDNARVLIKNDNLKVDKSNGYTTQLKYSLGSMPSRGAVWIKPKLVSRTLLDVQFVPERVVLYDNSAVATVDVIVSNVEAIPRGETIVVTNDVEACDAAFSTSSSFAAEESIHIDVMSTKLPTLYTVLLSVIAMAIIGVAIVMFYSEHKRRQMESVWLVEPDEIQFGNPPDVIGRGTFGMVLLGEYRGTQVAVKRVLPPKESGLRSTPVGSALRSLSAAFNISHDSNQEETTTDNFNEDDTHQTLHTGHSSGNNSRRGRGGRTMGYRSEHKQLRSQFKEEMKHLSKLRHPCITTVMGAVVARTEDPMLVMEYMELGSLYDVLHNDTMVVAGEQILPILRDLAQGLRFLHAATPQVIHGDLKAANVLLDYRFRAKVTDFGLSQKRRLGASGTPYWMAPELIRGESGNTTASDVYSFGIVLFEVYSRSDPYDGEDYEYVMRCVADPRVGMRPPVPESCPTKIKSIMVECLDGIPANRPSFEGLDYRLKDFDATNVEPTESHFSKQTRKQGRTEGLLFDVFPQHIARALRDGQKVEPESHEIVTIFFSDIVGFTDISSKLSPIKISDMLDRLYQQFDSISRHHDVFKVETIGDAWMGVTNLISNQPDHVKRIADFAVDAIRAASATLVDVDDPDLGCINIRVGFHSGPVVANVVGSRNPRYCLFGDTVNTASRMESNSKMNRIHCSERSVKLLYEQDPNRRIQRRGKIKVKGKGEMCTYWVNEGPQRISTAYFSISDKAESDRDVIFRSASSVVKSAPSFVGSVGQEAPL